MRDNSTDSGFKPDASSYLPKRVDFSIGKLVLFYLVIIIAIYFLLK